MVMAGPGTGMNMNGADASAAAGLNTTKANWHYTGPALPTAEAQELLAQGENGPTDIHMLMSGCTTEPTFSEQINAAQYVQSTSQAVARYSSPSAAVAAGYVPVSPTTYPVVYYVNPTIVAANAASGRTLDPQHVDGLVFAETPSGQEVLAAAMYLLPSTVTPSHALRRLGPVASTDGRLWPEQRVSLEPPADHGRPTLPGGERSAVHAVHDHGLAGAGGRRPTGHSTAGHPDRRGGGDVGGNVMETVRISVHRVGGCLSHIQRPRKCTDPTFWPGARAAP